MTLKHRIPRTVKEFKRVKIFSPHNWSMYGNSNSSSTIDFIVDEKAEEVILFHVRGIMPMMEDVMAVLLQDRHVRRAIQDREKVAINDLMQYNCRKGQSGRE